jgi:hypothetical protein
MGFWLLIGVALLALPAFLYLAGRRSEEQTLRRWELVLTPRGAAELQRAQSRVSAEVALLDLTYSEAQEAARRGRHADAIRLVDAGCRLIESYSPDMTRSLAAMSVLSRMASAMAPMRPLRPERFALRELAGLAFLHQFLHNLIVSTGERFRLRLYILSRGFGVLMRTVRGSTDRVREAGRIEEEWPNLDAAQRDLRLLGDESLASLHALLLSLPARAQGDA